VRGREHRKKSCIWNVRIELRGRVSVVSREQNGALRGWQPRVHRNRTAIVTAGGGVKRQWKKRKKGREEKKSSMQYLGIRWDLMFFTGVGEIGKTKN